MSNLIKEKILAWVEKKSQVGSEIAIDSSTPILEQRIISSIQIMDLILYLQHLKGKPIDVNNIQAGVFSSVNTIVDTFFVEEVEFEDSKSRKNDKEVING